jgi:hypothetical protein
MFRTRIALVIAVMASLAAVLWMAFTWRSAPGLADQPGPHRVFYPDLRAHGEAVNELPMLAAGEMDAFEAALSDAIDKGVAIVQDAVARFDPKAPIDARKPDPSASRRALDSLRRTLVEHVSAITADSSGPYLDLADREATRWIGPGDTAWNAIDPVMQFNWQRDGRRDDARGELAVLLDRFWFGPEGNRFVAVAADDRGMAIFTGATRTAADADRALLYEYLDDERYQWHRFPGSQGIRTRHAILTARDIVRRDGAVQYAQSVIAFKTASGNAGFWWANWYYDPASNRWLNGYSGLRSPWRDTVWIY